MVGNGVRELHATGAVVHGCPCLMGSWNIDGQMRREAEREWGLAGDINVLINLILHGLNAIYVMLYGGEYCLLV